MSVVVPFGGSPREGMALMQTLARLARTPDDEVIVVDNSVGALLAGAVAPADVAVLRAAGERSSYFARNEGARHARHAWLLFLDADCSPVPGLLDAFFAAPIPDACGALAGAVVGRDDQNGLLIRYARHAGLLDQQRSVLQGAWAYGVTANLLVRRAAWEEVDGFCEGIRSGGDVDLCWRLRDAGWTLQFRPQAEVLHRHRETLSGLVRQTARTNAGCAWLRRRYPASQHGAPPGGRAVAGKVARLLRALRTRDSETAAITALGAMLLCVRTIAGLASNRPPADALRREVVSHLVLCADRFPADAAAVAAARGHHVEALRRPARPRARALRGLSVAYREDDGTLSRWRGVLYVLLRHPQIAARWLRTPGQGSLCAVAPAARRAARLGAGAVRSIDGESEQLARELGRLLGEAPDHHRQRIGSDN